MPANAFNQRPGVPSSGAPGRAAVALSKIMLAGVAIALTVFVGPAASAEAVVVIAPIPKIHAEKSVYRLNGRSRLLLKSLQLYGVGGLRRDVTCNACLRRPGKIRTTHPASGSTLYQGLNWVLLPGRTVLIKVFHPGQIGRFLRLAASVSGRPDLVFSASGCLASFRRVERCPRGTPQPKAGSVVPQAPAVGTPSPGSGADKLAVVVVGTGTGKVSGGGISCPGACSVNVAPGGTVALTAVPAGGSAFAGWSGPCTGTGACTVTLSSDQSVTATFTVVPHQLAVSVDGSGVGSVGGSGIACPGTCTQTYASGTSVSLAASAGAGSTFAGWGGACSGTGACTVTMGSDQSVSATFNASTHAETTGGATNTWTNYSNAGGTQGPTIPANQTVQISCVVSGFRVPDGDTSWYRIASSPWNGNFYASADAFYNNGQTSGPLSGTPFVDPAVPGC